jgi:hypothetical protein
MLVGYHVAFDKQHSFTRVKAKVELPQHNDIWEWKQGFMLWLLYSQSPLNRRLFFYTDFQTFKY